MPLAHLIFFEDPRELTEAQIEEARQSGLLRDEGPGDAKPVPADRNNPVTGGQPAANVPAAQPPGKPADTKPEETPT